MRRPTTRRGKYALYGGAAFLVLAVYGAATNHDQTDGPSAAPQQVAADVTSSAAPTSTSVPPTTTAPAVTTTPATPPPPPAVVPASACEVLAAAGKGSVGAADPQFNGALDTNGDKIACGEGDANYIDGAGLVQVAPAPAPVAEAPPASDVYYANCAAAKAAGAAPINAGEPGYRSALDRDNDGVACDK